MVAQAFAPRLWMKGANMREWLVIDNWDNHAVFGSHEGRYGYIPRDIVEGQLGIELRPEGKWTFFSREQSEAMRAHPLWRDTEPPGREPLCLDAAG
jgi:hypothetical protein